MDERIRDAVRLIEAPDNFEVVANVDGYAEIFLRGEIYPSNLGEERYFSDSSLFVKIVNESDGSLVISPVSISVEDSAFCVTVEKIPVGGPYTVDFVMLDRERCVEYSLYGDKVYHLFVGDVYLIAGQSNAAGMGRGEVPDAPELGVSVMRNLCSWDIASMPFTSELRHNMLLSFAKSVKRETGIPIGLIPAAACDSPLSRWLLSEQGDLYRRALNAVGKRHIKGVIWYQGCRDAGDGVSMEDYLCRFSELVSNLRRDLESSELPVFTFQLNRQRRTDELDYLEKQYDGIREAQRRAAREIPHVTVLPTIDALNMSDFIHNSRASNIMLGARLGRSVLHKIYSIGVGAKAPEILAAKLISDRCVRVTLDNVTEFLSDLHAKTSEYPISFTDSDGRIPIESVRISGNEIEITLLREPKPPLCAHGQTGIDPRTLIIDYGTGIPMLCFTNFPVSDKRK